MSINIVGNTIFCKKADNLMISIICSCLHCSALILFKIKIAAHFKYQLYNLEATSSDSQEDNWVVGSLESKIKERGFVLKETFKLFLFFLDDVFY